MALKKIVSIILCVCMLSSVLTGCKLFGGKDNPSDPASTNPGGNNGNGGGVDLGIDVGGPIDEDGRDWSKYDWTKFDPADLLVDIGKASFTVDNGAKATGEYIPGEPFSLSVTDSAGATWTLEIPANGLLSEQTITMTALRDITTNGLFDTLDGGVLLEPDGLTFFVPATLTVSGGGYGADSVMVTGNHSGGNLDVPFCENGADSVTMYLTHFSSVFADMSTAEIAEKMLEISERKLTKAQKAALELLKKPNYLPDAEPPTVWFDKCGDSADIRALKEVEAFCKLFREPETAIILALCKDAAKATEDTGKSLEKMNPSEINLDTYKDVTQSFMGFAGNFVLINALYERMGERANKLIDEYKYKPEKYYSVAMASSILNIFLGVSKINQKEMEKWWKETWNYHMNKLVNDHDYHRPHALEIITFIGACTGVKVPKDWELKLGNALTFRVEWEYKEAQGTAEIYYLSGEAVVSMDKGGYLMLTDLHGEGEGVGRIDKIETVIDDALSHSNYSSFNNSARLSNLDPCRRKKITVGIDGFGEGATYTYKNMWGHTDEDVIEPPQLFKDKIVEGFYTFEFDIINLKENCVDDKYEVNLLGGSLVNEVKVKLFHAPKEDVFMR